MTRTSLPTSPGGAAERAAHRVGAILVTTAIVIWSTAGLFARLIAADTWTLVFWRSVFGALFLLAVLVRQERQGPLAAIRTMTWPGWAVAILSTIIVLAYMAALRLTAVADVMIIQATVPFVVAALAWLVMRERASRATLVASALATIGVAVMLVGAPLVGNPGGVAAAFGTMVAYAGVLVLLRWRRGVPMTSAAYLSALLGAAVALPFSQPTAVSASDLFYLVLLGGTQTGLAFWFLTIGSRLIPATETALISVVETPLGPLWVWLAFGEVPTTAAVAGGAIVLIAVLGHIVAESRHVPARRDESGVAAAQPERPSG
jgi:drug/metabolite transporter (DMT)-like permease